MALNELPLAIGGMWRDFEADVFDALVKHRATMHGCPFWKVEAKLDGGMAIWFKGPRDGIEWSGALRFRYSFMQDRHLMADVNAVVETTLQLLDGVKNQTATPLIERGN